MNPSNSQKEREINAVLGASYLSIEDRRWANQRAIGEGADMSELPYDIEPEDYYTNYGTQSAEYYWVEDSNNNDYPPYDSEDPDTF